MAGRTGRKPLYNPENLEIGGRIELKGAKKKFRHQYIYNWEKRINEKRIDLEVQSRN